MPGGRAAITEEGRKNVNVNADGDGEVFGKHGHDSGSGGSRDYLLEGDMYCLCAPMMVTVDCVHVHGHHLHVLRCDPSELLNRRSSGMMIGIVCVYCTSCSVGIRACIELSARCMRAACQEGSVGSPGGTQAAAGRSNCWIGRSVSMQRTQ